MSFRSGCWLLVAGCWLLVAGCWLLVAGCWLLVKNQVPNISIYPGTSARDVPLLHFKLFLLYP